MARSVEYTGNQQHGPDPDALLTWIRQKAHRALNAPESSESNNRQDLRDVYLGENYGDEEKGFSSVITRQVFQSLPPCEIP